MKKIKKNTPEKREEQFRLEEPSVVYGTGLNNTALTDITYNDFKTVADKISFTLAEWADILHVSERTLQRYAKDNHAFAPINAERLVLADKVIGQGKRTFGKTENFYNWLKREPVMEEGTLSVKSLTTFEGIQNVLTQLGRIQHGLFA